MNRVGTHVPWLYDAETIDIYRHYSELRESAAPLIRELWEEATRTGTPPTRPMWLAEPDSPEAQAADQQWMLGDDLLVAPVVVEGATSRDVYFPEGCWEDQNSRQRFTGPTTASVSAPLEVLPYFVRCESEPVVPVPPTTTTTTTAPATTTTTSPVGAGTTSPATPVPIQPKFTG